MLNFFAFKMNVIKLFNATIGHNEKKGEKRIKSPFAYMMNANRRVHFQ